MVGIKTTDWNAGPSKQQWLRLIQAFHTSLFCFLQHNTISVKGIPRCGTHTYCPAGTKLHLIEKPQIGSNWYMVSCVPNQR